jgi:hypothetical protein
VGGEFFCKKLRKARVVVEMPLCEGDVDVARLADRLAVVEGFQDGEEAGVLLQEPGQRVEVFRARSWPESFAHFGKARVAAATAASTSSDAVPWVTSASTSPVAGFFVAKVSPGLVNAPSMKCPKAGPLSAIQARTSASLSGAGP